MLPTSFTACEIKLVSSLVLFHAADNSQLIFVRTESAATEFANFLLTFLRSSEKRKNFCIVIMNRLFFFYK